MSYTIKNRNTQESLTQSFETRAEATNWAAEAELPTADWEVTGTPSLPSFHSFENVVARYAVGEKVAA